MSSISQKRKMVDLKKLQDTFKIIEDPNENWTYYVHIFGPKDTPFENGSYWIRMIIVNDYPFKSPSVAFMTPIFHPNIEYESGSVCLDVLNQEWTPVYSMHTIFSIFIPQLLTYPNEKDPFNIHASEIFQLNKNRYHEIAKKINEQYATNNTECIFSKTQRPEIEKFE